MVQDDKQHDANRGLDPVWGIGIGIVGLLVMGIGGATTEHYLFNMGEAAMSLGATLFLAAVVLSWNRRRRLKDAESTSNEVG